VQSLAVALLLALPQTPAPPSLPPQQPPPPAPPTRPPDDRLPMNVRLPPVTMRREQFVVGELAEKSGVADAEPVLGVTIGKESRAYPIAFVAMDEVVNDELAGVAIAITW
jgi:hypothetical protein